MKITKDNIVIAVGVEQSVIRVNGVEWFSLTVDNTEVVQVVDKIASYINSMYVFNDTVETLEYYLSQMEEDYAY